MSLKPDDIKKIAHLSRLSLSEKEVPALTAQLSNILELVAQMNQVDTSHIEPLNNPLDLSQRMREDIVTEQNQRDTFQAIAPCVKAGLYIVPQVIEDES